MENIEVNIWWYCWCDCNFCGIFKDWHYKITNVSTKEVIETFSPLLTDYSKEYKIDFNAVESTTNPDFPEIIKFFKSFNNVKRINLITSWIKIYDKEYLKILVNSWLNEVTLSIHSSNSVTEWLITANKNIFYKKILSIKNVLSMENVDLYLNFVINIYNYKDIRNFIIIFYKIGVRHFNIFFPKTNRWEESWKVSDSWVKMSDIELDSILELKTKLPNINISLMDFPICIIKSNFSTRWFSYLKKDGDDILVESEKHTNGNVFKKECEHCIYYKDNSCNWISEWYYLKFWWDEFNPILE